MIFCDKCYKEKTPEQIVTQIKNEICEVKGETIEIVAEICSCKTCGTDLWFEKCESANMEKAYSEYRRRKGLLQPKEIKAIREKYAMSQKEFADVLGMPEKRIKSFENGSIQENYIDNLIRLCEDDANFKKLLTRGKKIDNKEKRYEYV